jgi:predicted nucleic acid-binding protein
VTELAGAFSPVWALLVERTGRTAPFVDGQIAAIAVTSGIPLITANATDLRWFKGLTVHDWVTGQWV